MNISALKQITRISPVTLFQNLSHLKRQNAFHHLPKRIDEKHFIL